MSAEEAAFKLLQQHNKPFNAQSITDWLAQHGYKKAQVQKALDALAESGRIVSKEFGKTKIYIPLQDLSNNPTAAENDAKKSRIAQLQVELKNETALVKQLEQELNSWNSSLTEEELQRQIAKLTDELQKSKEKLVVLKGGAKLVKKEDRETAEKVLAKYMEEWRKRKAIFKSCWAELSENIEGKQADLFEEMGVETDEEVGVSLLELQNLLPKRRRN